MVFAEQNPGNTYYLEVTMFGAFAAATPTTSLTFRSDKVRALLVYLILHPAHVVSRVELVHLLYGDYSDPVGRKNLNLTLTRLRQSLAPVQAEMGMAFPLLEVERDQIRLNWQPAWHWADVLEFNALYTACGLHPHENLNYCAQCQLRLQRMVYLYAGDFMAGLQLADSPDFNEWRLWQQGSHLQQVMVALSALTEGALAAANYNHVQLYARRQIALVPWQERAHQQLMQALAAAGDHAAALIQFSTLKRILADRLQVEPSADTLAQMHLIQREAQAKASTPPLDIPSAQAVPPEAVRYVSTLLTDPINRLMTLVGPMNGSKELAQTVGRKLMGQFPQGVWYVGLADLPTTQPTVLAQAVAAAFQLTLPPDQDLVTSLCIYLRPRRLLLILDAFTPFIQPTAPEDGVTLVMDILQNAPQVTMLVVASRPLQLQQEIVYRL